MKAIVVAEKLSGYKKRIRTAYQKNIYRILGEIKNKGQRFF